MRLGSLLYLFFAVFLGDLSMIMGTWYSLKGTGSDSYGFREDGSYWQWAIAPRLTVFLCLFPFLSLLFFLSF